MTNDAPASPFAFDGEGMAIDVWSDVMCPFCYIGDELLGQALAKFPHGDQVTVRYHSYLLNPELPVGAVVDIDELLVRTKGWTREQAKQMNDQVAARAASVGLEYRMDAAQSTNMRDAHRLSHFANEHGKQHEMMQRLFKAYFTDGLNVGDHEQLADLAAEVGLDRAAALAALAGDDYAADVDADIALARAIGIQGVPFFVLDGKYAVSGAQPVVAFEQALAQAWNERGE